MEPEAPYATAVLSCKAFPIQQLREEAVGLQHSEHCRVADRFICNSYFCTLPASIFQGSIWDWHLLLWRPHQEVFLCHLTDVCNPLSDVRLADTSVTEECGTGGCCSVMRIFRNQTHWKAEFCAELPLSKLYQHCKMAISETSLLSS